MAMSVCVLNTDMVPVAGPQLHCEMARTTAMACGPWQVVPERSSESLEP